MSTVLRPKIWSALSLFVYLSGLAFFYYKYVPLAKPFQAALIPILLIIVLITALSVEWGALFFIFSFPLINNLPYLFGITPDIPHAPAALVLALAFFFGWLINKLFFGHKFKEDFPITRPLLLLSLIVLASAIITVFRYANFFPFGPSGIHDLVVNVNSVRAGGAIMSTVFTSLNYLTGFALFFILVNSFKDQKAGRRIFIALSLALFISLVFAVVQRHISIKIGNTPFWVAKSQINSTFKDPNSFGAFLSACFPLLLGVALSYRGKLRPFCWGLMVLTIYVFPWTGLRSGFLALLISLIVFFLLAMASSRISKKKKIALAATFIVVVVFFLVAVFAAQTQTILAKRLSWSLKIVRGDISLAELFTEKLRLWRIALSMVKDYPLTGVGVGAYIVELPNYSKLMEYPHRWTDSAENYFLQVGSELGLIGLFLLLWLFYEIIRQMKKIWKQPEKVNLGPRGGAFVAIGIISGILSLGVNFIFHSFIGGFEIIYLLWLLTALIFILSSAKQISTERVGLSPKFKLTCLVVVLAFSATHLWNSAHSLSIQSRTEKLGLEQDFGLYSPEKDERLFSFRWAKEKAGLEMEILGPTVVLPVLASHPDLEKHPVRVRLYLADRNYRKKACLKEIILSKREWQEVALDTTEYLGKRVHLMVETNRAWLPSKLGIPDARKLAVALGEEWFRYPEELAAEKIKAIQKIPSSQWRAPDGKPGRVLFSNGKRHLEFETDQETRALRLFLKGQKALHVGPYVIIRLDGKTIAKTMLTLEEWTPLLLTPEITPGAHTLEVEFTNDLHKPELHQDRNVFLGDVEIIYLK